MRFVTALKTISEMLSMNIYMISLHLLCNEDTDSDKFVLNSSPVQCWHNTISCQDDRFSATPGHWLSLILRQWLALIVPAPLTDRRGHRKASRPIAGYTSAETHSDDS